MRWLWNKSDFMDRIYANDLNNVHKHVVDLERIDNTPAPRN